MPEISLAVQQFNAPGVYITQDFAGALPTGIVPFSAAYIFGEISETVSTSLTTGIPYNVPILITSLEDFETRLGNGVRASFSVPPFGPGLDTYNSVKMFFRNAASDVAASLYFIRVKPVGGCSLKILDALTPGEGPVEFVVTDNIGVQQTVYGYPIEINGFQLGRVDYDSLGNATHIGVQVLPGTSEQEAAQLILDEIVNSPVGASVYARLDTSDDTIIELFPRVIGQELFIGLIECSTIVAEINLSAGSPASNYANLNQIYPSDDVINGTGLVEARDYVYSIENALDFTVFAPGFLFAPSAFAKFNPEDRLRVGTALENRAAAIDYQWMALVDSAPADGTSIQQHYGYNLFDYGDVQGSISGSISSGGVVADPFFLRETQQFFTIPEQTPGVDFTQGSTTDPGLSTYDVDLPSNFVALTVPAAATLITQGSLFFATVNGTDVDGVYVATKDFVPGTLIVIGGTNVVDATDPDGLLTVGLVRKITLLEDILTTSNTTTVAYAVSTSFTAGELIDPSTVIDPNTGVAFTDPNAIVVVLRDFTSDGAAPVPMDTADPVGDGSNQTELVVIGHVIPGGAVINANGILYFVRNTFVQTTLDTLPTAVVNSTTIDSQIPLAYYQEWVRVNLSSIATEAITPAVFNPTDVDSVVLGARSILYNAINHDALAREHLMYTSPFGYLAYYAPYLVDLEGFNVPPSSAVAGIALRRYREQGFQEPPAGVLYPILGTLRPQINITRAHQQVSNPTGLNAIRLLPNQGTVVWGARTRSSNSLFRWVNTRVILNVVINSLRGAFDDKIFRAIDGSQNLFRQIRGTAEGILYTLWQGQALYGATPTQAYRVIVNDSNNPDFNLENGLVNVDVFVVPVSTLEVILIRVVRTAIGQLDIVVSNAGQLTGV